MKKCFLIFLIVCLIMFAACTDTSVVVPDDTSADILDETSAAESDAAESDTADTPKSREYDSGELPPGYFEPVDSSYKEIPLPEEGGTLIYDPPITLFEGEDGTKLTAVSVTRSNNAFYFHAEDTLEESVGFDMIGMTIYTPAEEVFVSLNETDSSSPYDYVIRRYISGDATLQGAQRDLLSQFGDAFDPQKNYYRVDLYATYESDGD